jgi:hypothetical protein
MPTFLFREAGGDDKGSDGSVALGDDEGRDFPGKSCGNKLNKFDQPNVDLKKACWVARVAHLTFMCPMGHPSTNPPHGFPEAVPHTVTSLTPPPTGSRHMRQVSDCTGLPEVVPRPLLPMTRTLNSGVLLLLIRVVRHKVRLLVMLASRDCRSQYIKSHKSSLPTFAAFSTDTMSADVVADFCLIMCTASEGEARSLRVLLFWECNVARREMFFQYRPSSVLAGRQCI